MTTKKTREGTLYRKRKRARERGLTAEEGQRMFERQECRSLERQRLLLDTLQSLDEPLCQRALGKLTRMNHLSRVLKRLAALGLTEEKAGLWRAIRVDETDD